MIGVYAASCSLLDGRYQVLCSNCNMAKWTRPECPCQSYRAPEILGQLLLF